MATPDVSRYRSYLMKRGDGRGLFYLRYPIPDDLHDAFGKKRIVRPLKTTDRREAEERSHGVITELVAMFNAARAGAVTAAIIEQEARRIYNKRVAEYAAAPASQFTEDEDGHSAADASLQSLYEGGDEDMTAAADALLQRRALTATPAVYADLCKALYDAETTALAHAIEVRAGRIPQKPAAFHADAIDRVTFTVAKPAPHEKTKGPSITEAAKTFIEDRKRDGRTRQWTLRTELRFGQAVRLFAAHVKDKPIASVTEDNAASFVKHLKAVKKKRGPLANVTINTHIGHLSKLFAWARKPGQKLYRGSNPFDDMALQSAGSEETGWLPFTVEELNKLLAGDLFKGDWRKPKKHNTATATAWCILLGLYTGARVEELCGLRCEDIREEDGIAFIAIEPHADRRLKTKASDRHTPIHSQLVKRGFLKYVAHVRKQGHAMLFPGLKNVRDRLSHYVSKRFGDYKIECGITRERVAFHSLRNNVVTALDTAGVAPSDIGLVVGHSRGFTLDNYSKKGPGRKRIKEIVEMIAYAELKVRR